MQLTAEDVESAFTETVREQQNGEPFDWNRVALHLNERLADHLVGRSRFILRPRSLADDGPATQRPSVGEDGAAAKTTIR